MFKISDNLRPRVQIIQILNVLKVLQKKHHCGYLLMDTDCMLNWFSFITNGFLLIDFLNVSLYRNCSYPHKSSSVRSFTDIFNRLSKHQSDFCLLS